MENANGPEAVWFVNVDGSEAGPFTKSVILEYLASGDLTQDDLCWREGFPDWIQLGRTLEFAPREVRSPGIIRPKKIGGTSLSAIQGKYDRIETATRPVNKIELSNRAANKIEPSDRSVNYVPSVHDKISFSEPIAKKKNYFARHWRGELSLPISYWLNSYGATAVFAIYLLGISAADFTKYPTVTASLFISFWIMLAIAQIWLSIGILRSARAYSSKNPRKSGWGAAAMLLTVIGFVSTLSLFVKEGIPQISGYSEIISAALHEKQYSTRLLRNLTEVELNGPLDFGVSADLETVLNEYPTVRVLHLNSWGGRLAEAEKLKNIVLQRKLDTYVGVECQSACVTVFVAGNRRLISRTAVIGLHEPYFPGVDKSELAGITQETKTFFYSQGIKRNLVEKGFSTGHDDMWNPSHEELFASGLATGYAEENDVGLSGVNPLTVNEGLDSFSKISLYAAIKEKYPSEYPKIETALRDGFLKGKSLQELRVDILPMISTYYQRSIPTASLSSIKAFINLVADEQEALLKLSPSKCVAYLKGDTGGYNVSDFPTSLTEREMIVGTEVIRSTGSYTGPSIADEAVQDSLVKVISQASKLLNLADDEYIKGLTYELDDATNCRVFISYFRGLTNASNVERPVLLRYAAQLMGQ